MVGSEGPVVYSRSYDANCNIHALEAGSIQ